MTEPLNFKPALSTSSSFNPATTALNEGALTVLTDTQDIYLDTDDIRIKLSDVVTGTYAAITSQPNPVLGKIYFAVDTHQLLQAYIDNSSVVWHELCGQAQSIIVNNSDAAVSITLADNTIYNLTNNNITSITLTAVSGLSYCTLCFTAGTNTTFTKPSNSTCVGDDCSGGTFTPVSGRSYQIAVDVLNNSITLYVLAIVTNSGIITSSDATVSLTLANDTIYRCTNASLSSLTIAGLATGFRYAAVTFTSPSTPTTFAMPATGYYCVGSSCSGGTFTPTASMRYNLAIEDEGDRIAIYVMKAL